eukprot:sb/3474477/
MSTRDINPFVHLAAGSIGGSIGVILTSPIELVKTRQQSLILISLFNPSRPLTLSPFSGTVAGVCNAFMMNPFWVVKTRLQLDERSCNKNDIIRYVTNIWRTESWRGFTRGASASAVGSLEHGLYFLVYEELRPVNFV